MKESTGHNNGLQDLKPSHPFFVGIDSDGCVFDTMETKQKEFFIPAAVKLFGLAPVSRLLRETWEFVNLRSVYRGTNRFIALVKTFELLGRREEMKAFKDLLPDMTSLKVWISKESRLGNASLERYAADHPNPTLTLVLEWSKQVNDEIGRWMKGINPFPFVGRALGKIHDRADAMVVSQTPLEALEREWKEHGLLSFVRLIAGQEHGTKSEHLALAAKGKYPDERILMIGDSLNDLAAARNNNVLFFPVIPGEEADSWKRLLEEALDHFFHDRYKGRYEDRLVQAFQEALPAEPPWQPAQ